MKKWILVLLPILLLFSACGSSDSLDKDDLRSIMNYSANGYAELMLDTQTLDETDEYYVDKANELIEGIKKNNEKLKSSTTSEKKLKKDVQEFNDLMIQNLESFIKGNSDDAGQAGAKLSEITENYFNGELPEKQIELSAYFENLEEDSTPLFDSEVQDSFASSSSTESTSDITVLTETPSSEQVSILDELARTQFNKEFPYKGSKIHSVLGLIQDWTVSGDEWFYKAEATIVNEAGAERKVNVEIHIAPLTADSGVVSIIAY